MTGSVGWSLGGGEREEHYIGAGRGTTDALSLAFIFSYVLPRTVVLSLVLNVSQLSSQSR